jgi:hypothetical protein
MTEIDFQRIEVLTDGGAVEGRLALVEGQLVAVFVHVTPEETANGAGWFREAGFGACSDLAAETPPVFESLEKAAAWIGKRIQAGLLPN